MEKIFIWGTGFIAGEVLEQCDLSGQYEILGFLDNDVRKEGSLFYGKKVFLPKALRQIIPDKIVILTDLYDEIKRQISEEFPELVSRIENKNYFYKRRMMKRYVNTDDREIRQILEYWKKNNLQVFNYEFTKKYEKREIEVFFDKSCGMYFVFHNGKKLYFARFLDTEQKVRHYYRNLLMEQDDKSPHKYLSSDFDVRAGDIVVDAGVAEGNFSLDVIEKASKIYMIEADEAWIEAIKMTFQTYLDKIVIIPKFAGSVEEGKFSTLDCLIGEPVDFIKMDIEGNEWDALQGAEKLIAGSKKLKCAICAYHGDFDEILIRDILKKYKMECQATAGYMWFPDRIRQTYVSTRLCRGIIRASKDNR